MFTLLGEYCDVISVSLTDSKCKQTEKRSNSTVCTNGRYMKRDGALPSLFSHFSYVRSLRSHGWKHVRLLFRLDVMVCVCACRVQCLCDASEPSRKTACRQHWQFFQRPNRFRATIKLINILKSRCERNPAAISTSIEHHGDALQLQLFIRARMNSIERKPRTHGTAIIVHYPSIFFLLFSDVIY